MDDNWDPNEVSFDEQDETDADPLEEEVWHHIPEVLSADESQDWEIADHIFMFVDKRSDINPFTHERYIMSYYKCRKCGTNLIIPPSETPTIENVGMSCGEIIIEEIMGG